MVSERRRIEMEMGMEMRMEIASAQPSATSSTIITTNPETRLSVARSPLPPCCDSGTSSSTTTKIMAPAAKLSAYGRIGAA